AVDLARRGGTHPQWSGNGLNLSWVIFHGSDWSPRVAWWLMDLPTVLVDAVFLYAVWRKPVSIQRTLAGCFMTLFGAWMLGAGMNEGGLFPAAIVALYLFANGALSLEAVVLTALMMNANLVLINEVDGRGRKQ